MGHPFGNLLLQYRARKHGLSQTRLAHLAGYDQAVLVRMCQGKKDLTGPSGRDRILRIIDSLHGEGVLKTQAEANSLLEAASLPPLYAGQSLEAALLAKLDDNPAERRTPTYTPGIQIQTASFGQWLKARRSALDLTRAQLASQIGCAEITLGKIERDQRRPSKQIAELLARALHVPDDARDDFIQFARGQGEPPVLDGRKARPAMSAPLTNLPAPLTSFVDRTRELVEVCETLLRPDLRLLTLVGPPGIGKTRLSIQAGQAVLDHFVDGVWFVSLAPISDPELVLPTIASVFDIADAGMNPLITHVIDHLRPEHLLLVLDNFEQVLDAAPVVTDLLKACPKVKVLATSREPLHVYGEHEYAMPALSLPPRGKPLTAEQVATFDAIKLFIARAQAIQPSFALNVGNAPAVADICWRLEGVPLAIELAASRLRQFPLFKLRDALNATPLQALVGTARDVEPRQRTLQSAIQWSYDLLDPTERAAFARLGVFIGGASTEAALAVCELLNDALLYDLAEQNLLRRDTDEHNADERWTMLEMIREFALEVLSQMSGDGLEAARQRHAEYFAYLLQLDRNEAWRVIEAEQHNARAALRWLLDHKHPLTVELARFMSCYYDQAGLQNEALRILPEVLAADIEMNPLTRSDLLGNVSIHAWKQHRFEEGLRYGHESVALARAINAQPLLADNLIALSRLYIEMDDCAQAKQVVLEALQIGRAIQNQEFIAGALVHMGEAELILGNADAAETCFVEAYALCQAPDFKQPIYFGLICLGMGEIALKHRDYDGALGFLREGLEGFKIANNKLWILDVLAGVIGTMPRRMTAEVQRAAKIWGAAEALNEKMGTIPAPGDRRRTDALIAEARTRIAPKTFAVAWAEGRALSLDEAIELAMM